MTLKSDVKFEEKPLCCFKNVKNLVNFDRALKILKNLHFDWSLSCKLYNFDIRKYRSVIFHDTVESCKI